MNYSDLIARVPEWMYAQNRDLTAAMPEIVRQAHRHLFNVIDHNFFRTKITGVILPTSGEIDLLVQQPPIMELRAIRLKYRQDTEWTPLIRKDIETLYMLYANNRPGRPRYYGEDSGPLQLRVFPTPDREYVIDIACNQECPILSPSVPENLFTDRAQQVLEFATLRFAAVYMKNDQDAERYSAELTAALGELNAGYARRNRDDTGVRPIDTTNAAGA